MTSTNLPSTHSILTVCRLNDNRPIILTAITSSSWSIGIASIHSEDIFILQATTIFATHSRHIHRNTIRVRYTSTETCTRWKGTIWSRYVISVPISWSAPEVSSCNWKIYHRKDNHKPSLQKVVDTCLLYCRFDYPVKHELSSKRFLSYFFKFWSDCFRTHEKNVFCVCLS